MTDILMPRLTDQMEAGTIIAWLVEDGETVDVGQEIVEIETDKATVAHHADAAGVLETVAGVGDSVAVGEVIARVGVAPEPIASGSRAGGGVSTSAAAGDDEPQPAPSSVPAAAPVASNGKAAGALVTPLARRLAGAHGIDPAGLAGSGPGGRVTKADVMRAAGLEVAPEPDRPDPAPVAAPRTPVADTSGPASDGRPGTRVQQPTRLQQIVARRMAEAMATIPHFQVQTEVTMDDAIALRVQLKEAAGDGTPAPSINDLIVKACALTLPDHPLVNGSFKDGAFELHDHVQVGIAVASDDGLVVATIRRRGHQVVGSDRTREPASRRPRPDANGNSARAHRRDLHRLEPRYVRDDRDHRGHQPAPGRDPRRRRVTTDARSWTEW